MTKKQERKLLQEMKKHMDFLWSFIIRSRGKFKCALHSTDHIRCNNVMQGAHLITRRVAHTHWDLDNGVCLCSAHHVFYTYQPEAWGEACRKHFPEQWEAVNRDRWKNIKHADDLKEIFCDLLKMAQGAVGEYPDFYERVRRVEIWHNKNLLFLEVICGQ